MRTAFIASSQEAKDNGTAEAVAEALSAVKIYPIRWWQVFKLGEATLDQLRDLSDDVDAAVLIWDADNTLWHRGKEHAMTRDNCLLEYGLFVGKLGRLRTGMLVEKGVKLPSGLAGITVKMYNEWDQITAINELIKVLEKNAIPTYKDVVPIKTDEAIERKILRLEPIPFNWCSRSLYCRDEGAQNWLAISKDPEDLLSSYGSPETALKNLWLSTLKYLKPDPKNISVVVSLGPGDGRTERAILQEMIFNYQCSIRWIPVDISNGFLNCAIHKLKKEIPIPIGIRGDFEQGQDFIFEEINKEIKKIENVPFSPILLTLIGATFGNLDEGEKSFLVRLKGELNKGDYFLFDVPIKGSQWSFEKDPRSQLAQFADSFKEFLCSGLAFRLGIPKERLLNTFLDRIKYEPLSGEQAGEVNETNTIRIYDRDSQLTLLKFRRYSWNELLNWIENKIKGFKILFTKRLKINTQDGSDIIGVGVILLQKI